MYKRRQKFTSTPQVSVVSLSNNDSKDCSFQGSQMSTVSSIISRKRSASPEDMFSQSDSPTKDRPPSVPVSSQGTSLQKSPKAGPCKPTASDVMNMLMSSQESEEPLSKVAKLNQTPKCLESGVENSPYKYLEEVLADSGFLIGRNGRANMLRKEQSVFVRNLTRHLEMGPNGKKSSSCIDKFLENLEKYLSDNETLKAVLSPTKSHPDCNAASEYQESLLRLLLGIDCLQVKIIDLLIDKIAELSTTDEKTSDDDEGMMWLRLILQSMRYLTKIFDPKNLTQKLFDIIHSASSSLLQHEVINCLPDIIGDDQRDECAIELMELMKNVPSLTPSILSALSNLCLDSDSLYELQLNLIRTLRKTPLDQLPAFIRFITMGNIANHADEIINGLRSELVICHPEGSSTQTVPYKLSADLPSTLIIVFEKLRDTVLISRKLADLWLKNIVKVKLHSLHKPIDLLMLLIMHSMTSDLAKKKAVESAIKNKIKIGHFRESLVQDTLSVAIVVIKEHFSGLLKLLSSLLQSPDVSVSTFAAFFYTACFERMDSHWCKLIILELLDNVRMSKGNARSALNLLHDLTQKYPSKVAPYITLIMLLLDSVTEMKVVEVRQLVDMLCLIAYGDPSDTSIDTYTIQDEISMVVQKELNCPDPSVFRTGIVSAIVAIKHIVKKNGSVNNETPSSEEEEIPLSPLSNKAYNLLELVLNGCRSSPEAQILTYDQLSYVVMTSENMDKAFMKKVSVLMQSFLQNNYIIASSEYAPKDEELDVSLQFCIDKDFQDPILLNLVDAVVKEAKNADNPIPTVALPGLVRVIRALELADLTEIDALLGCSVSLPGPHIYTKFGSVEPYIQRIALDCLFHTTNWFREMINSFVYMVKENNPDKVLMRLRAVVHFQNLISICLPQAFCYSPPHYYFDYSNNKSVAQSDKPKRAPPVAARRRGKNKNKLKENDKEKGENDESVEEASVESEEEKEEDLISVEFSKFKQHLRELDFDVFLILTQPLVMAPEPIKDGMLSSELGPGELLFLLDDLNSKLKFALEGGTKRGFPGRPHSSQVGFDNLSNVPLDLVVRNTSKLSHHLTNHLQKIVEYLYNLIRIHDEIMDAPGMFCPGSAEIKQSLALILSIFNTYFSWPDITSEFYSKCLIKSLLKLRESKGNDKVEPSLNSAINDSIAYLKYISQCILDLTSAVSLVNLIKTLMSLRDSDGDKTDVNLGKLCDDFLRKKWYDNKGGEVKGSLANQQQSALLDVYLTDGEDCLGSVVATLAWLVQEAEGLGNDNALKTFPHFNKNNLNLLIRSVCKALLWGSRKGLERKDYNIHLEVWNKAVDSLQQLVTLIKIQDSKLNLRQFLKGCLPMLRLFLSQGMTVCTIMFKIESGTVSQMIKKLQVVTRYIQSVCNYSKISKDKSLMQQLPGIRGTLETILLSVKNMVLQNKCTGAFFMGSMRNKDIHGEVISSQDTDDEDTGRMEDTPEIDSTAGGEGGAEGNDSGEESDVSVASHCTGISETY